VTSWFGEEGRRLDSPRAASADDSAAVSPS
jgi:hypothetical protein